MTPMIKFDVNRARRESRRNVEVKSSEWVKTLKGWAKVHNPPCALNHATPGSLYEHGFLHSLLKRCLFEFFKSVA